MYSAKDIILSEIKPALGCTEPAAIALNAAYLRELIDENSKIKLVINTNLVKNAMYVPIPNTGRKYGVKLAFALGFVCGKKEKGLNIFEGIDENCLKKAETIMENIEISIIKGHEIFIKSVSGNCEVITEKYHDGITKIKSPYNVLEIKKDKNTNNQTEIIEKWFKNQKFEIIYDLIEKEKNFDYIKDAVDMNLFLAKAGMNNDCALNVGKKFNDNTLLGKIINVTVSASDARMEGMSYPAMSLIGSGNHGISAILPVWVYGKEKNFEENEILKSIALSMLITVYVKLYLGRLSPICGAAFASGCGVAGAISYLETGDVKISAQAVKFVIDTINGVVCDGAKMGCSLKVLLGVESGYKSAIMAMAGEELYEEGVLEKDLTKTIKNLEKIRDGMSDVDGKIVEIMIDKL